MGEHRCTGPTRRAALRAGAAALLVPIHWPAAAQRGARARSPAPGNAFEPSAWLRITPDNRVTVRCPGAETGQGVWTALAMLVAEELDADWSRVGVEPATSGPPDGTVFAPTTLRAAWEPLRDAAAAARAMLVSAAAEQWKLDPAHLRTELNHVIAPDRRRLAYGALAARASRLPVPRDPVRKPDADSKLLGRPLARLDTPGKVNGSSRFGIDAQVPGQLVAVLARAPLPGASLVRCNDAAARAIDGVRQVHLIDSGVAVLADGYWAAQRGRDALEVEWDLGALAAFSTAGVNERLRALATIDAAPEEGRVASLAGQSATADSNVADPRAVEANAVDPPVVDAGAAIPPHPADAARELTATYETPFLAHACMEPMNCTAHARGDAVELWVGTQAPDALRDRVAERLRCAPTQVTVHTMLAGGSFGRRRAADFGVDAAVLSQLSGRPVKLIYSRADDLGAGQYHPAAAAHLTARLDAAGRPTQLRGSVVTAASMAAPKAEPAPANDAQTPGSPTAAGDATRIGTGSAAEHPYDLARLQLAVAGAAIGPSVGAWRSADASSRTFFIESFIDELAAAAGRDACDFRRELLVDARCRRVLDVVAERADWGRALPAGVGRGVALASCFGSVIAEVAEVSTAADGRPKVLRVVAAVDCGRIVNPQIVRRQVEGAIVFGLTAALHGRISFSSGRIEQSDFDAYPLLRIADTPRIDVHLAASREAPGGAGALGTPAIAPAVANAIFAATGQRLRTLPFEPFATPG